MRTACALALFAVLSAPVVAHADEGPPVTVIDLLDGRSLRGDVVEIVPDSHCTIVLAGGARARVPWKTIRRISSGDAPPLSPPPSTASGTAPAAASVEKENEGPPAPPPPEEMVFVSMRGSSTARLEIFRPGRPWETICVAPCETSIPRDASYRVVDGGRVQSQSGFGLRPSDGRLVIDVSSSSTAIDVVSGTGLGIGSVMLYGALLVASNKSKSDDGTASAVALVGLGAVVLGTIGLLLNRSSVTQRAPTSKDVASPERPRRPVPSSMGASFFTLSF